MVRSLISFILSALLLFVVAGCGSEADDIGVVARVNGKPIYLTALEAKYDLSHLDGAPGGPPSPESLKQEYLSILKDLIAQELVLQVLQEKGMPVSDEELNMAEAKVRMDYPKGGFEQVLVEEYIDLETWRQQLVAYLSYEKFLHKILQPKVKISPEELQAYYQHNKASFIVPARLDCIQVEGKKLDTVKHVLTLVQKGVSSDQLKKQFPNVEITHLVLPENQLPESKKRILAKLKPGQCSSVNAADVGFEGFVLRSRLSQEQLQLADVKSKLSQLVMEEKLQNAYVAWLENELASSKISISESLLDSDEVVSRAGERQKKVQAQKKDLESSDSQ